MALKTTPFDAADYLNTAGSVEAFLRASFEEGTPSEVTHALGVVARARGMSELARDTGLSRQALYKALSADGNPSFATIVAVAEALGFRLRWEEKAPA
jgi:probable addiction module antidote protein